QALKDAGCTVADPGIQRSGGDITVNLSMNCPEAPATNFTATAKLSVPAGPLNGATGAGGTFTLSPPIQASLMVTAKTSLGFLTNVDQLYTNNAPPPSIFQTGPCGTSQGGTDVSITSITNNTSCTFDSLPIGGDSGVIYAHLWFNVSGHQYFVEYTITAIY